MPDLDRRGEEAAARHAEAHGARVVARNWRGGGGELDLVLEDGSILAFGEVKTRAVVEGRYGTAVEAVTRAKVRKIVRASLAYLQAHALLDRATCRFDIFAVAPCDGRLEVEWVKDAFTVDDAGLSL